MESSNGGNPRGNSRDEGRNPRGGDNGSTPRGSSRDEDKNPREGNSRDEGRKKGDAAPPVAPAHRRPPPHHPPQHPNLVPVPPDDREDEPIPLPHLNLSERDLDRPLRELIEEGKVDWYHLILGDGGNDDEHDVLVVDDRLQKDYHADREVKDHRRHLAENIRGGRRDVLYQQNEAAEQHQKFLCHQHQHYRQDSRHIDEHTYRHRDKRHLVGDRVEYLAQRGNLIEMPCDHAVKAVAEPRKPDHQSRQQISFLQKEIHKRSHKQEADISQDIRDRDQITLFKTPTVHSCHHNLLTIIYLNNSSALKTPPKTVLFSISCGFE